jgi:mRNA-degrading endonuclease RelE of RelBE toxin-antitoxin system
MNYSVASIPLFDKQAKRLAKKFPSLKDDLSDFVETLIDEPEQGDALGNNFFKIRMAITSKGKGKSGGARIISYIKIKNNTIYLTSIYDKSKKSTLSNKELKKIFELIP